MNTVKWALAGLVLAASIQVTAATDVCADYRAAIALHKAAVEAAAVFEGPQPWPYDFNDKSPEAQAWFATKRSFHQNMIRTYREARKVRLAVIASVEDKDAARVVDDIESISASLADLNASMSEWKLSETKRIGFLASGDVLRAVEDSVNAIGAELRSARQQVLLAACVLAAMPERDQSRD